MRDNRTSKKLLCGAAMCVVPLLALTAWSWWSIGGHRWLAVAAAGEAMPAVGGSTDVQLTGPVRDEPAVGSQGGTTGPLEAEETLRVARLTPPVADRVVMDPSIAETPSLPLVEPSDRSEAAAANMSESGNTDERSIELPASTLARQAIERAPDIADCWPLPIDLLDSLFELDQYPATAEWSRSVRQALERLHQVDTLSSTLAGDILAELESYRTAAQAELQGQLAADNVRARLLRTAFSLQRRLAIWQRVHQLAVPTTTQVSLRDFDPWAMSRTLAEAERQLQRVESSGAWREYLLMDNLEQMAAHRWSAAAQPRSQLAQELLRRLESANATPVQEDFFARPVWRELADQMRQWVTEPIDYETLLDDLESLERTGGEDVTRRVAEYHELLRWSPIESVEELGSDLNTYYRNANVRLAVSAKLLNRLLPNPETIEEDVNDTLLGGRIFGRSRISTRLRLVLFPDRQKWNLGLEAHGNVDSRTETKHGPAVFHNAGRSRYLARKLLQVDRRGVNTQGAEAAAVANHNLTKVETDYDGLPLVNLMARAIAKQQYDSKSEAARWQAEGMVADRAQERLDAEFDAQLDTAMNRFRERVLEPLQTLGLRPEATDLQTTDERLIARYRLAGYHQLGAFTPRPQAPVDSLFSLQVHESTLNNIVLQLDLAQREVNLRTLFRQVADKFRRSDYEVPEDVPEDVTLILAERDAITFACEGDRIHLTLRIDKLASGDRNVWRNFVVRASYGAELDGLHVRLVRDGYIRLKGRLSLRDQVALRGVFSKVLAQNPQGDLLGNVLVRDKRLHDLRVTQFVIRDGWIGLAVGEGNPVRVQIADQPESSQRG